jgi:protein-disulfide isomerase
MAIVVIWGRFHPAAEVQETAREVRFRLPTEPVALGTNTEGAKDAPVSLLEFSDFECVYCGQFARETLPALKERYIKTGKLAVSFRHFPNERDHLHSRFAAEAAQCAGAQGRFWEIHDTLFSKSITLDRVTIRESLKALPVNQDAVSQCLSDEAGGVIDADVKQAVELHLPGTPAFLVGLRGSDGTMRATSFISGARSIETFSELIEKALKKVQR